MSETPLKERQANPIEYPFEYFDAQIQFALKWAAVTDDDYERALLFNTALYRRLIGSKLDARTEELWDAVVAVMMSSEPSSRSHIFYKAYLQQKHSVYETFDYSKGPLSGVYFGCDYHPNNLLNEGRSTIRIHYLRDQRGAKSGLHSEFTQARRLAAKQAVLRASANHPEAQDVVGGSWLYTLPAYRESFPPEFTANMRAMVPQGFSDSFPDSVPYMSFSGNSLWGQLMDRFGYVRMSAYVPFIERVSAADSPLALLKAFPTLPLQPRTSVEVFRQWQPELR